MKYIIVIPQHIKEQMMTHLFQNELEQGAFLFANTVESAKQLCFSVVSAYLVPPAGWKIQLEDYLEMDDAEKAKIMKDARDKGYAIIDCHSHPGSKYKVCFSPSDIYGITEFVAYSKWKLDGKPFAAMVWGESSLDAIVWHGKFVNAHQVDEVHIIGSTTKILTPTCTWFKGTRYSLRGRNYGI